MSFTSHIFILVLVDWLLASSSMNIWEPRKLRELYKKNPLKYTLANFGAIPYGHSIYGTVFMGNPLFGCKSLDSLNWDKNSGTIILFLERGGCHYATKVLNA